MNQHYSTNRTYWDELAEWHYKVYNLQPLREGKSVLDPVSLREVGDVNGKSLLHLHCHVGSDSLSWVILGAKVTGVDFSAKSLEVAARLAGECNLRARWVESDIHNLSTKLDETFDVVFATQGVFSWVRDLKGWIGQASHFVKPGGILYLQDCHPFLNMVDLEKIEYPLAHSYFTKEEPTEWKEDLEHTDWTLRPKNHHFEWRWPIGDIVTSVAESGLRIDFLHEFGSLFYQDAQFLIPDGDGWWTHPLHQSELPMTFSLKASRPIGVR